jgi:hypothetical protein
MKGFLLLLYVATSTVSADESQTEIVDSIDLVPSTEPISCLNRQLGSVFGFLPVFDAQVSSSAPSATFEGNCFTHEVGF